MEISKITDPTIKVFALRNSNGFNYNGVETNNILSEVKNRTGFSFNNLNEPYELSLHNKLNFWKLIKAGEIELAKEMVLSTYKK